MLGNESAKKILKEIFDTIHSTGQVQFPFVIVQWTEGTWVLEYLLEQTKVLLWWFSQDLLLLRDMPWDLEKKSHALKVDVPNSEQVIESEKYWPSANLGARAVSERLSRAPAGKLKIVMIEHIERMTTSAANALLKSFEEPLPWRIILATSTNTRKLLDTIVSRAFVVTTQGVTVDAFLTASWATETDTLDRERAFALVWNDAEAIKKMFENESDLKEFSELETLVINKGPWYRISALAKILAKKRPDQQLLNALIQRAERTNNFSLTKKLTHAKSMIAANVNTDHVWYGLGVEEKLEARS